MIAETIVVFTSVSIFGSSLTGTWGLDFLFAYISGIIFQYYSIKPMKKLSSKAAIIAALKADTLSLIFWQLGMYGWMALALFVIFKQQLAPTDPLFWFMMQIAMLTGFVIAYPINLWLVRKNIKMAM